MGRRRAQKTAIDRQLRKARQVPVGIELTQRQRDALITKAVLRKLRGASSVAIPYEELYASYNAWHRQHGREPKRGWVSNATLDAVRAQTSAYARYTTMDPEIHRAGLQFNRAVLIGDSDLPDGTVTWE